MRRTSLLWLLVTCLPQCLATSSFAATIVDSALRFRQLETEHFVIYFHQGEDGLAARLAGIAEDTWHRLPRILGLRPPPRTYVVLSDHTDTPNGWATQWPYNLIVLAASAPSGTEFIGNTSDWLRLVFVHEFTHIVHLDQSIGWARGVRNVFGRVPFAFPNLFLPTWQIEGLATFYEGSSPHEGRLHAMDFREVVRARAVTGRPLALDQAGGGLTAWPSGWAPYAYGVGFHQYLSHRFGADRFGELARRTAGRIPYTGSRSFMRVYGESLGSLWADYQRESVQTAQHRPESSDGAVRLTHDGFVALGPRFSPPSCPGCSEDLVYSSRTPHDFPALMLVPKEGGQPRKLATRYLGSSSAVRPNAVVFDQQERRRNTGLYSDLFVLDRASGRVRPLSHEARLADPDLTTDGTRLVATRQARGRRELVVAKLGADLMLGSLTVVATEPDTQFWTPRWSPDGSLIAAERRRLGSRSEIVVVDIANGSTRVVARGATRAVTPAWRPDGRAIVAAIDSSDGPFNLFEFDAAGAEAPLRRLSTRQAMWPDVSADGRRLAFVSVTDEGFDIFSMAYPGAAPSESVAPPSDIVEARVSNETTPASLATRTYRPWSRLAPTAWFPIVEGDRRHARLGLVTSGVDPLGYHAYAASATWLTTSPAALVPPPRAEPDWSASYAYDRWQPRLFAAASRSTSFTASPSASGDGGATVRERREEVGLLLPLRRVRWTQRALLSVRRETGRVFETRAVDDFSRIGLRAGWAVNTPQLYGYSISPERGVSIGVTAEAAGAGVGSIGEGVTLKGDGRAYLPGLDRHHVFAVRLAAARSTGPRGVRRLFVLGGSASAADVLDLGGDAVGLLRGLPGDRVAGPNLALINADYRWPIARVERGVGTWPLFLHTIHASVFTDVGHAWSGRLRARDLHTSVGLALSADVVAGYALPLTATVGVAWRPGTSPGAARGGAVHFRIGAAF